MGTGKVWRIYEGQTNPLLRSFLTPQNINAVDQSSTYNGLVQSLAPINGLDPSKIFSTFSSSADVGVYGLSYYSNQQGYDLIGDRDVTLNITAIKDPKPPKPPKDHHHPPKGPKPPKDHHHPPKGPKPPSGHHQPPHDPKPPTGHQPPHGPKPPKDQKPPVKTPVKTPVKEPMKNPIKTEVKIPIKELEKGKGK
ncbi:hypothetical protein [Acinetobacter terrae]|uniref:hypothetical protein n=1 Tax=Acinetobacter terrae TaxID=2731247 RepID=UPI001F341E37|nr:hypothetical protein [Acinetobacter terrae]